jgi:hypothetical protein
MGNAVKAAVKTRTEARKREMKHTNKAHKKYKEVKPRGQEDGDSVKVSLPLNPSSENNEAELESALLGAALTKPQGQPLNKKLGKDARRKAKIEGEKRRREEEAKREETKKEEEDEKAEEKKAKRRRKKAGAQADTDGDEEKATKRKSVKQEKAERKAKTDRVEEEKEQLSPTHIVVPPSAVLPPVEVTTAESDAKRYNLRPRPERAQKPKVLDTGAAVEKATKKGRTRAARERTSSLPAKPATEQSVSAGDWRSQIVQAATVGFPRAP